MIKTAVVFLSIGLFIFSPRDAAAAEKKELSTSAIFQQEADAVVLIGVFDGKTQRLGSGFFVHSSGIIATNFHLVSNVKKIFVKSRNNTAYRNISILCLDGGRDIALLKVGGSGFKVVKLGNSDSLQVGQRVMAIGNPLGLENTVSDGLVSAIRRVNNGLKVIQATVPVSQGSSGGPLFDLRGDAVGITTGSFTGGQNLNFAIPINYVKSLLVRLGYLEASYMTYVVKSGDTLYGLARRFHTTVKSLMESNNFSDARIYNGQKIKIPR